MAKIDFSTAKILPSIGLFFGFLAFILSVVRAEVLWVVVSVVYLIQVYGVWKADFRSVFIENLTIFMLVPLLLGSIGVSSALADHIVGVDLAFAWITPLIGFVILFNLNDHSSFNVNRLFTVSFVALFSMGAGAALVMIGYLSDQYIYTNFILGNDEMMIDLFVITIFGFAAGLLYTRYLKNNYDEALTGLNSDPIIDSKNLLEDLISTFQSGLKIENRNWMLLSSKILQLGIVILGLYAAVTFQTKEAVTAVLSLVLILIMYLFGRKTETEIPYILNLWISVALFLHILGGPTGIYDMFAWWDNLTHAASGSIVAILTLYFLIYTERIFRKLYMPTWLLFVFVILFMLSLGVVWELFEFFGDQIFGTMMQESLHDTVYDMIYNVIGAFISILVAFLFFPFEDVKSSVFSRSHS